jgi:hypothetical protein
MQPSLSVCALAIVALAAIGSIGVGAAEYEDPTKTGQLIAQKDCDALKALLEVRGIDELEVEAIARIDAFEAMLNKRMPLVLEEMRLNYNIVNSNVGAEVEATAKIVENMNRAGKAIKFGSDRSLVDQAKAGLSAVASTAEGVGSAAKSLSIGDARREAEQTLEVLRYMYRMDEAALASVPSLRDKVRACAKERREKLMPPLPPQIAGSTNRFGGNWHVTCDDGSPTRFNVSGQFVFDVMPPNSVFIPLKGSLVGGDLDTVPMEGMILGGDMSASPPGNPDTNFTFTGSLTKTDGLYAASGDVMALYKGKSACVGKFST